MADDKKTLKFQMMMSPQEAELLDDWMFRNRVRSRAEAIRRLWQMALELDEDLPEVHGRLDDLYEKIDLTMEAVVRLMDSPTLKEAPPEVRDMVTDVYSKGVEASNMAYLSLLDAIEIYRRVMPFATKRTLGSAKKASQMDIEEVQRERFRFHIMVERKYPGKVLSQMSDAEREAFENLPFRERQDRMSELCEKLFDQEMKAGKISDQPQ